MDATGKITRFKRRERDAERKWGGHTLSLPSPLRGGVGGGGRAEVTRLRNFPSPLPPSPPSPTRGEGARARAPITSNPMTPLAPSPLLTIDASQLESLLSAAHAMPPAIVMP